MKTTVDAGHKVPDWAKEEKRAPNRYDPEDPKPFTVGGKVIEPENWQRVVPIDRYLLSLMSEEPFYAAISQQIEKVLTLSIPTMAVGRWDDSYKMLINPQFVSDLETYVDKKTGLPAPRKPDIMGVLQHELNHVILGHLDRRLMEPHTYEDGHVFEKYPRLANWATDSANNSLLVHEQSKSLPYTPVVPGLRPGMPFNPNLDPISAKDQVFLSKPPTPLEEAVMTAEKLREVKYYYERYKPHWKFIDVLVPGIGTDAHESWLTGESNSGEAKEQLKAMLRKAVSHANQRGWGTVSDTMQARIRSFLDPQIDWKEQLSEWLGNSFCAVNKMSTHKRVNRKYPYIVPGFRRGRGMNLAICIDMSGSVDDTMLHQLCSELPAMGQMGAITIIPFDYAVIADKVFSVQPGETPDVKRVACGGTNFQAPTDYVNHDSRRDEFDVTIFLTDGEAPQPSPSRVPRCWLLPKGRSISWKSEDKVIVLDNTAKARDSV